MNARGKQLTPFENFKANFIQLIDKYFTQKKIEHPIKGDISYSGYFSYKIEKEWTDLFWAFRGEEAIVDSKLFSFFEFVAQMCYFKKHTDATADSFNNSFSQYEDVFQEEENVLFLFNSLDRLYSLSLIDSIVDKQRIDNYFQDLKSRTQLFWNSGDNSNLFERVINNVKNEDPRNKILLYTELTFLIRYNTMRSNEEELSRVVRVVRNLMQATRQRNETKYNTNIRINNFGSYWLLLRQLLSGDIYSSLTIGLLNNKGTQISDASLNNEIEKASILIKNDLQINQALIELEEFEYFGGLLHLLRPKKLSEHYLRYAKSIREIFGNVFPSSIKLRALISCGFAGIYTKDCRMGRMQYFGKNDNWASVLTSEKEDVSNSIVAFLDRYSLGVGEPEQKLNHFIEEWSTSNSDDRSWRYYFIKYPEFTSKLNYYVRADSFEARLLGTDGPNPLVAYHISPYVLTVCKKINDISICDERDCYLQYSGHSPLVLKNGIALTCTEDGWQIEDSKMKLPGNILEKYQIEEGTSLLKEIDSRDKIELVIAFIRDLVA